MPRACTVCAHAERAAIDRVLASGGTPNRRIATQYSLTEAAIRRHKAEHMPVALANAQEAREAAHAAVVMAELRRCFERVNLLFDAAEIDEWTKAAARKR